MFQLGSHTIIAKVPSISSITTQLDKLEGSTEVGCTDNEKEDSCQQFGNHSGTAHQDGENDTALHSGYCTEKSALDCHGVEIPQFRTAVCSEGQIIKIEQFSESVCATILESHCQNNDLSIHISKDSTSLVAMDDVITPSENIALKHCDSPEPAIIKAAEYLIKSEINTESHGADVEGYAASPQMLSATSHQFNIGFDYIDIKQIPHDIIHVNAHMD